MSVTSLLFRLARLSADARSVKQAIRTGSPRPVLRRLANKAIGRTINSRLWFR